MDKFGKKDAQFNARRKRFVSRTSPNINIIYFYEYGQLAPARCVKEQLHLPKPKEKP